MPCGAGPGDCIARARGAADRARARARPEGPEPGAIDEAALESITAADLRGWVTRLADDRLEGRGTPSVGLDEAAKFIEEYFVAQGLQPMPGAAGFQQRFECGRRGRPGPSSNVLAMLPGRDKALAHEMVVVSAHYDHLGHDEDADGDGIYNGANDNASGVAAVMAVAKALTAAPTPPRRSVVFMTFCGEELGLLGSKYYVEHPLRPLEDTVAVVNLEMLGRGLSDNDPTIWITGMDRSNFGSWFIDANVDRGVEIVDSATIGPFEARAFGASDNAPFAAAGVIAHTLSTGRVMDGVYHTPQDEADTMNYDRMEVVVRAAARGVYRLAEHDARPQWVEDG